MHPALIWVMARSVEWRQPSRMPVYLTLLSQCQLNSEGELCCQPTKKKLAEQTGLRVKAVRNATRFLEQRGIIRIISQRYEECPAMTNRYVMLATPPSWQSWQTLDQSGGANRRWIDLEDALAASASPGHS